MTRPLPHPVRERWQPLRVGLVDLFFYDVEEFWFHDGRLLLRGNNGTGKSKVLALTLPFLLDGDLSAHRVEPDGDPKKRMEWNLLLGGEHPHPERLGYTWIEFGRREADGTEQFTTLGCGLKAVSGRGIARHWFFRTDQRIGVAGAAGGLELLDATRSAIGRDRLVDAVAGHGTVYDSARAYRRAVDEALFGLGEARYGALVDLLVQLRAPQLSKRPDEKALSKALTEALPPMDQAVVADVAEAFRSLDEEKTNLVAMVEAERAAAGFLDHYRRYARTAARRKARLPRREQSRYEALRSELVAAEEARTAADEAVEAGEARLAALAEEDARLRGQDAALRESPEMRSARELDTAADRARRAADTAEQAGGDRDRAVAERDRAGRRLADAFARVAAAEEQTDTAAARADDTAVAARIGSGHGERVAVPLDAWRSARPTSGGAADDDGFRDAALASGPRRAAEELAERRLRSLGLVEGLLAAARAAQDASGQANRRLEDAEAELAAHAERSRAADEALSSVAATHVAAVREHLAGARELRVADPNGTLDLLAGWVATLVGASPARLATDEARRVAFEEFARTQAGIDASHAAGTARADEARAELADLQAGRQRPPRPPHTRGEGTRTDRPGAPLWRLVDFADHVSAPQRAGIEAALEAAGLLDAWVAPDGAVTDAATHDVLLVADAPLAGPSLADVLRPASDHGDAWARAAVTDSVVVRVLECVGFVAAEDANAVGTGPAGEVRTWIAADGRFRNGPLRGAWTKPAAQYLGEGAREEARRVRIGELRDALAGIEAELAALVDAAQALADRHRVLDAESAAHPAEDDLRRAHARLAAAAEEEQRLAEKRESLAAAAGRAAEAAWAATAELRGAADEVDLPAEAAPLRAVREALSAYREALAALWPAVRELAAARAALTVEADEHTRATEHAAELAQRAEQAGRDAVAARERHETLQSTVGAAVTELARRLDEVAAAQRARDAAEKTARRELDAAREARGEAAGRRRQLETDLDGVVRTRLEATEALRRFVRTGLLDVALPGIDTPDAGAEWAADPAVRLARTVERELSEVDDSDPAWERVQRRTTEELKNLAEALSRHGHTASADMLDDGIVVSVVFHGRPQTVPRLVESLAADVADRQRLLSEREQEILENHLITEVAGTLTELIGAADRQVLAMNTELAARPTSTGVRLRLQWRPARDAPSGLAAARARLLRQTADAWSAADRAAVGQFLQGQIDRVRADDPSGTWLEHLTKALDYRAWHSFAIERHQHGRWQSATGPASGGERVLSVSIPLFAATSAHYASAGNPHCPRLVTLDEAFAGVDDDSRAKSLGLLAAFDLDVVMTSEREWGCYPQVPGLAIAQLSRVDEFAAVLVTRWEWDGRERRPGVDPGRLLPAAPARGTAERSEEDAPVAPVLLP